MEEITYISKEIIDINKDGTPNYAVWRYISDSRTKILISIERLK
jgi:hypothetical protein